MLDEKLSDKVVTYLNELRKYESQWVAVVESEDGDIIVGNGKDAVEAKRNALEKGFDDVVLFWVRPSDTRHVPSASTRR
jgi:hypothetical protein